MNKSLTATAALALCSSSALAESTVAIFGVMDGTISRASQNGVSKTYATHSGNISSQLGFRGTEDLGGGLTASFWLEAGVNVDTGAGEGSGGALAFNRRSTVELAGSLGTLRLGREYTPSIWNHVVFDPFGVAGVGSGGNITANAGSNGLAGVNALTFLRSNNTVSYLYGVAPNAGSHAFGANGIYAQLMYGLPENTSGTASLRRYLGGRVGYKAGPWNMAAAYAQSNGLLTTPAGGIASPALVKFTEANVGLSYDFGVARLMAKMGINRPDPSVSPKYSWWSLGATIPLGQAQIPVSINQVRASSAGHPGATQLAMGYVYNLSKRTAIYTTYSHIRNRHGGNWTFVGGGGGGNPGFAGTAAAANSGNGGDVGLRVVF